jgi:hypothetical protein
MKDKETGLTLKTLQAVDKYLQQVYELKNTNYTFPQALRDSGYTDRYIHSYGSKIWQNIGVQSKINTFKQESDKKAQITVTEVLNSIEYGVQKCKECNNFAALARFVEMQGRYLAMFTDNINSADITKQRELEAEEKKEAAEIATIRLHQFAEATVKEITEPLKELNEMHRKQFAEESLKEKAE